MVAIPAKTTSGIRIKSVPIVGLKIIVSEEQQAADRAMSYPSTTTTATLQVYVQS